MRDRQWIISRSSTVSKFAKKEEKGKGRCVTELQIGREFADYYNHLPLGLDYIDRWLFAFTFAGCAWFRVTDICIPISIPEDKFWEKFVLKYCAMYPFPLPGCRSEGFGVRIRPVIGGRIYFLPIALFCIHSGPARIWRHSKRKNSSPHPEQYFPHLFPIPLSTSPDVSLNSLIHYPILSEPQSQR